MKKLLLIFWLCTASFSGWTQVFTSSHLPILVINTTNGQEVPDEPKITAQMRIIDNGPGQINHLTDPANAYNGAIGIERRGSSSFYYDKKPYTLELRDANGDDQDVSLMGMPAESDFALISPLNDKTLMRDVLAHTLARQVLPWSPRTRYTEVMLNGQYIGVYVLIETIKRGNDRVDIAKLTETDLSGPDVTGGYILRMDKFGPPPGNFGGHWKSNYPAIIGGWQETWFQHFYPKQEDIALQQQQYIRNYIDSFEDMLISPAYLTDLEDWIDLDSWVDYALIQEISKNTDGYRLSAYFYKDKDDASGPGKITMGPVWDCNISFGIGDYCQSADWQGWDKDFNQICGGDSWVIHFWWNRVWNHPAFQQRMSERWQELRAGPWSNARLNEQIDSLVTVIGPAQVRNFQRWPVMGTYVWPNAYIGPNYNAEVNYLKNWLINRAIWMDANIPAAATAVKDTQFANTPYVVYPNPVIGERIYIKTNSVVFAQSFVFTLYDRAGKVVHTARSDAKGVFWLDLPVDILANGLYFYTLTVPRMGDLIDSGPLMINR